MTKVDDHHRRLQRYFDGELDPEARARFEAELTEDDRERLAALEELRGLVGNSLTAESAELDLWAGIERGLLAAEPAAAGKVVSLSRWRTRFRGRALGASAGLLTTAAAAAFLLLAHPFRVTIPTNGCDVESVEVSGAVATVLTVNEPRLGASGSATVIWTEGD